MKQTGRKKRKAVLRAGDVIAIRLPNGDWGYGRVREDELTAFYESRTKTLSPASDVVRAKVAFVICVMDSAFSSGRWSVIGSIPLDETIRTRPTFFRRDSISGKLTICQDNGKEKIATVDDCRGLEADAVWSAEHVESRLDDHTAGRQNKWVEALRPR